MVKGLGVASMQKNIRQFWVVGRKLPSTDGTDEPTCYRIRVFAKNAVLARSQFWYEMKRQNKVRKCQGEIVSVSEIFEKNTNSVKNYGIVFKYLTRKDYVNMYKEYRDVSLCGAVAQLYTEISGRHSGRHECLHIIKTVELEDKDTKRTQVSQYTETTLKFPQLTQVKRAPTRAHKSLFKAN